MLQEINDKLLEKSVWKFLDLLDSKGYVEETGQEFELVKINGFNKEMDEKLNIVIKKLRQYSSHKSNKKYQTNCYLK